MRESQGSCCINRAFLDGALLGFGKPRWCNVNRLREVGALERIGLIENCQHAHSTIAENSLECHFSSRDVTLHQHLMEIRFASGKNLRGFEQPPETHGRREKLFTIVCTDDALAR